MVSKDAYGRQIFRDFDLGNNVTREELPTGIFTTSDYDLRGNLWSRSVSSSPENLVTKYYYNNYSQLTGVTDPRTHVTDPYLLTLSKTAGSTTTCYLVDEQNPTTYPQVVEEHAPEPASTGLVEYWPLDDSGSTAAVELKNGTQWSTGVSGGGLRFDGVDDYVEVKDAADLQLGNTMTIALWVKKDAGTADYARLVGKGTLRDGFHKRNYGVWTAPGSSTYILFQIYGSSGGNINLNSTVNLDLGTWYHVACTYDGTTARIYVNGAPAGQVGGSVMPWTSDDPLTFGYSPGWHSHFPGSLDEIRIYSRALAPSEIAALAQPPATYVYGLDLISQTRNGATSYYGYDGHGSVRFLMNASGTVTDTYTYDAFGIQIASTGANTPNNYRYAGERWDPELGMYYLRARYYNPQIGRFWTMDTFEGKNEDPVSLHKYLYAGTNPVNYSDPSGNYGLAVDLGRKVHGFLATKWEQRDSRFGRGLGGIRWGNRQVRTIANAINPVPLPAFTAYLPPYNLRPDLAEIDSTDPRLIPPTKGYLFEIKPGILSMTASPALLRQELSDAATQLGAYFALNHLTQDIWERGTTGQPKAEVWMDFRLAPPGTCLVTLDVSAIVPGMIIYEFLPTKQALEFTTVGIAAAVAERYGVSAAINVAVRGMIQAGARAAAAYATTSIQTRAATAALGY